MAEACALSRSLVSARSRECNPETVAKTAKAVRMAVIATARLLNARPGLVGPWLVGAWLVEPGLFGPGSFGATSVATPRCPVSFVFMARTFLFRDCPILNTLE